jgi:hypothetical protein
MFLNSSKCLLLKYIKSSQLRLLSNSMNSLKPNSDNNRKTTIKKLNVKNALICEPNDQIFSIYVLNQFKWYLIYW